MFGRGIRAINPHNRFDLSHLSPDEANETFEHFLKDLCFWGSLPTPVINIPDNSARSSYFIHRTNVAQPDGLIRQKSSGSEHSGSSSRRRNKRNNNNKSDRRELSQNNNNSKQRPPRNQPTRVWKTAVDPVSGQTYYYDPVSRQTQWDKPDEIRALEKQQRKERRQRDKAFFAEMEKSMRAHLKAGRLTKDHTAQELAKLVGGPPKEPLALQVPSKQQRIRTISAMDEKMLANVDVDAYSPQSSFTGSSSFQKDSLPGPPTEPPRTLGSMPGRPPLPSRLSSGTPPAESSPDDSADSRNNWDSLELSPDGTSPHAQMSSPELQGMRLLDETQSNSTSMCSLVDEEKQPQGHIRRNTSNTMFVNSTMTSPDITGTIRCVCGVYRAHIMQSIESPSSPGSVVPVGSTVINPDVFRDQIQGNSLKNQSKFLRSESNGDNIPALEEIEAFYKEFFRRSQMEHDTIIMSLIYIERLIKRTEGLLSPNPGNWRSMLFSSMILASKVWDDLSMWNIDFSNVSVASGLSSFTIQRINQLEIALLSSLRFDVRVSASEYAKYYFLIRTMLFRSGQISIEASQNMPPIPPEPIQNRRAKSVDWGAEGLDLGEPLLKNVRLDQHLATKNHNVK